MFSYSSLDSSSSSLEAQLSHYLLQEDCLKFPTPPTLAGLETPSSGLLQPLCLHCQGTFYPTSHRSCLDTHGPQSIILKIMGSEVRHTCTSGTDLTSLIFCFILGQMGTLITFITLDCLRI